MDPPASKKGRKVAGCPEAMELAGPPAEGPTEDPMSIVDRVAIVNLS